MGCAFAKSSGSDSPTGAGPTARAPGGKGIEEPPEPPAADPRLPLTARQKFSISKSWKGVARALEPTGVNMFVK